MSKRAVLDKYRELCLFLAESHLVNNSDLARRTSYYRNMPEAWGWREDGAGPVSVDEVTRAVARAFSAMSAREVQLWAIISNAITRAWTDSAEDIPAFGDWADGWESDNWQLAIAPGQSTIAATTDELVTTLELIRHAAHKGTIFEQEIATYLAQAIGQSFLPIMRDKSIYTHGADAYFAAGGLALGLASNSFFVEAKAGDSAIKDVTAGIRSTKTIGPVINRDTYVAYLAAHIKKTHGLIVPADTSVLFFGQSFTFDPTANVPADLGAYFDGGLVRDVFGHFHWVLGGPAQ